MTPFYDARGNIYAVLTHDEVRGRDIDLPDQARDAAQIREHWTSAAIEAFCSWAPGSHPSGSKDHRCDGLLVGPFQSSPPFDLLIVNTDGTLAERSGNGLTIFAQALSDQGLMTQGCELRVHHDKQDAKSPLATYV